ncbi:hypothetical protein SAMN05421595_0535 [Austwickia chelonae]|uniref:Uncharacterized protein n=1 Tax=Austwickia chelonae NBRC 105200 TaxID=1184607 RepID=K6VMV0_9MICO|nr:hypothetical protein [Austwickia chelonae]GAB78019.1 hypothetical protein AUCHE_08_02630 [Austwickia chelonae NBRC 105200]SEV94453.1 hypothetical protein SAMN05421595_0535 [Austwickia chelonae]
MAAHQVDDAIRAELERLGRWWRTLPLPQALVRVAILRSYAQSCADECADLLGRPQEELPDLGPATLWDQVMVVTYDLSALRGADGPDALAKRLVLLRRQVTGQVGQRTSGKSGADEDRVLS